MILLYSNVVKAFLFMFRSPVKSCGGWFVGLKNGRIACGCEAFILMIKGIVVFCKGNIGGRGGCYMTVRVV